MEVKTGIGEVTSALLILTFTVVGGIIVYSGLRENVELYTSNTEYGISRVLAESKTMIKVVDSNSNSTSTMILVYNYGFEEAELEEILSTSVLVDFKVYTFYNGVWVYSSDSKIPAKSLALIILPYSFKDESLLLIFRGGVSVEVEV